jgi:hypothetical protein
MSARGNPPLERRHERAPGQPRGRFLAWGFSIAAHLMVFALLFWPHAANPPREARAIPVNLVQLPKPEEPPGPPGPPGATVQPELPQPVMPTLHLTMPALRFAAPVREAENAPLADDFSDLLSDSQLTGAASADGTDGGGGGGCDMGRAVQQALRRDPLVHSAVEDAHRLGKSVMLWNGDWVRSGGQDGKGMSAVREAILWELAFAPEACRNQPLHGLVLLSLADGGTRFAIGASDWRWSDLLGVRPSVR